MPFLRRLSCDGLQSSVFSSMLLIPAALLTAERTDKLREPGVRSVSGLGGLSCCLASSSDVGDSARLEWNEARGWCLVDLGNFGVLSLRQGADRRDVVGVFFRVNSCTSF